MRYQDALQTVAPRLGRVWLVMGVVSVLLGVLPLLAAAPAPLQDWPSHLSRVWITGRVLDGAEFWADRYELHGFLIPNAALDLGVLGLSRLGLGHAAAGTAFLLLTYAAFVGGFFALASRTRAVSGLTLPLAVACFYSTSLFYGLVNFVAGLALMLWALAGWCALERRPAWRAALAVAAALPIALCHVIAALVFVGVAGCLDLVGALRRRRPWGLLPATAGLAAVVAILASSRVAGDKLAWGGYSAAGTFAAYAGRKATIFVHAMMSGQVVPDILLWAGLVALAVLAVQLRPRVSAGWGLAVLALVFAALAAPDVLGEGAFFDARLAPLPILLACATVSLRGAGPRVALLVAALLAGRSAWLAADWRDAGQIYAALDAQMARLPPGSTLLGGWGSPESEYSWADEWAPPTGNIASLAAPHGVFVPTVFASPVQQPLALRPAWRPLRHYMDMTTPEARVRSLDLARTECGLGHAVNMLVIYNASPHLSAPRPDALPGVLARRFSLVPVC